MKTLRFKIEVDSTLVDAFCDYLIGMHDAVTEFTVDDEGAGTLLQAFVEKDVRDEQAVAIVKSEISSYGKEIAEIFSRPVPIVSVELIENSDWAENWKTHFKPFAIIDGLVIAPTWEPYSPQEGEQVIVMDPGMAFGTGHHATTRLCLEILMDAAVVPPGSRVLDVGTGTGILAMASLLQGASRAVAIDNDEEAVRASRTNAKRNKFAQRMDVSGMPLDRVEAGFDLVIANIVHDILVELSGHLAEAVREGGYVLLSGLIEGEQSDNLIRIFEQKGFQLKQQRSDDPWCALLLQKTDTSKRKQR